MSRRAMIAQFREELDAPTLTETSWSEVHREDGEDEGYPTLDREFSEWGASQSDDGEGAPAADELPTETTGLDRLLDGAPMLHGGRRRAGRRCDESPQLGEEEARTPSGHPQARRKETVWDAVEERYKAEGHFNDLLEMYLQRVEGTNDYDVKGSLFMRIGQLIRDELGDPQQALDAFVEAMVLDPRNPQAVQAVRGSRASAGGGRSSSRP